jgi:hypothetical protein
LHHFLANPVAVLTSANQSNLIEQPIRFKEIFQQAKGETKLLIYMFRARLSEQSFVDILCLKTKDKEG